MHYSVLLNESIDLLQIKSDGVYVDGTFGRGGHSREILKRLGELEKFGLPILVGASRKGFVGEIKNYKLKIINDGSDENDPQSKNSDNLKPLPASERLEGSLACAAVATMNGASILRVHDVKESRRVVDMVAAIMKS